MRVLEPTGSAVVGDDDDGDDCDAIRYCADCNSSNTSALDFLHISMTADEARYTRADSSALAAHKANT